MLQANPNAEWEDLTERHTDIRERIDEKVKTLADEGNSRLPPTGVIGPYRAGKTQLLYHTFREAWARGIPALYTDAITLFNEFESQDSDISSWLESRVDEQVTEVLQGEEVDWLPNWETSQEREKWLDRIETDDIEADGYTVLLVDEVEQAYAKLRRSAGEDSPQLPDTDDRNPLRIILDEAEDIHQVWGFGLVSAYEFRGEADAGRFEELRLPILTPDDVAEELQEAGKPPELATGIWWLARGRIGWIRKLVSECPESLSATSDWVTTVSNYKFSATSPLDKKVFEEIEENEKSVWDQARRSIVFTAGPEEGYSPWVLESERSLHVSDAIDICIDSILSQSKKISFKSKELIERNVTHLIEGLCPAPVWVTSSGEKRVPFSLLFQTEDAESFLVLLRNFVISFEGGSEQRKETLDLLNKMDASLFRDRWMEDASVKLDETGSWSIKPSILNPAYPPIAVNPSRLTNEAAQNIADTLESGIAIETGIHQDHVQTNVVFCPRENIFIQEAEKNLEPRAFNEVTVLIIPEEYRDEWELPEDCKKLVDYERLSVEPHGGRVFWDFVLQLRYYLDERQYDDDFSEDVIGEILADENDREQRNTIRTLYEQVETVTEDFLNTHIDRFVEEYSLPEQSNPIWGDSSLNTDVPFWSWGGAANIPRTGLSYAVALSDYELNNQDFLNLRPEIMSSYENENLQKDKFNFQEFLDLVFTNSGVSAQTSEERQRFGTSVGEKHPGVKRFRDYLWELATTDTLPKGQDPKKIVDILLNPAPLSSDSRESVKLIKETNLAYNQAPALAWGLLIDAAVSREFVDTDSAVEENLGEIQSLRTQLQSTVQDLEQKNQRLNPNGVGNEVRIELSDLENGYRNLENVHNCADNLRAAVRKDQDAHQHALVFSVILDAYTSAVSSHLDQFESTTSIDLSSLDQLEHIYEQLQSQVEGSKPLQEIGDQDPSEILDWLREQATDWFDFKSYAGSPRIAPDDTQALREIQTAARQNVDRLDNLLDDYYAIEDKWSKRQDKLQDVVMKIKELDNEVTDQEGKK